MSTERIDIVIREDGSRAVQKSIADIGETASKTGRSVELLKTALEFAGITVSIAAFVNFANQGIEITNILKNATEGTNDFNAALAATQKTAVETGTSTRTLAELYDTLATAGKSFHATQEQTSSIVDTVARAYAAEGKSADEAGGAIKGLARALLTGTADMRGFLTILNSSNLLAEAMAKQFGLTAGAFVEAVKAGKISSEDFFKALLNSDRIVADAYGNTSRTLAQAFGSLHEKLIALATNAENTTGIIGLLSSAIIFVAEHLSLVIPIIATLAVAWVANMVRMSLATGALSEVVKVLRVSVIALNLAWYSNPIGLIVAAVAALAAGVYFLYTQWNLFRKAVDTVLVSLGLMTLETARAHEAASVLAEKVSKASAANSLLAETGNAAATSLNLLAREADGSAKAVDSYGNAIVQVVTKQISWADSVKAAVERLGGSYSDLTDGVKSADSASVHFGDSIAQTNVNLSQGRGQLTSYRQGLDDVVEGYRQVKLAINEVNFANGAIGGGTTKATSGGGPFGSFNAFSLDSLRKDFQAGTLNALSPLFDNVYGPLGSIYAQNLAQILREDAAAKAANAAQSIANTPVLNSPIISPQQANNNVRVTVPVNIITPNPRAFGASQDQISRMLGNAVNRAMQNG